MLQTNSTTVEETGRDWVRAHAALSRLARERAAADAEEGRWLLRALRSAAHVHLGFGSFGEYVERLFGYKPRSTQEKLRVAEALEQLPRLAHALDSGSLGWSAARELTRVAVADTESDWLELAQGKTLRQLEELVAGKSLGDNPAATNPPAPRHHVLRFEVTPETFALFREALLCLRRRSPGPVDDDTALLSMARHVLGEHREDARSSYQIALSVCNACGTAQQQAGGQLVPVGADILAMAQCDGQHLGHIPPRAANENALPGHSRTGEQHLDYIPPRAANENALLGHALVDVEHLAHRPSSAANENTLPGHLQGDVEHLAHRPSSAANENTLPGHAPADAEHVAYLPPCTANENSVPDHLQSDAVHPATPGVPPLDAQPCSMGQTQKHPLGSEAPGAEQRRDDAPREQLRPVEHAHVGACATSTGSDAPDADTSPLVQRKAAPARKRASQTIPPALRRAVLVRDGHCCRVPGCKNSTFLDLHHIQLRSEGGRNVPENILTLCGAHHRAIHRGSLLIEKDVAGAVRFRHGDGSAYGQVPEPQALDMQAKLFSALRGLGFREGEVRAVLTALRQDEALRDASIQHLLREALRRIRPACARPSPAS